MFYSMLITVSNFRTIHSLAFLWTQNVVGNFFRNMWTLNIYLKLITWFLSEGPWSQVLLSTVFLLNGLSRIIRIHSSFGTNCIRWAVYIAGFHKKNLLSNQYFAPKCMECSSESDAMSVQSQWVHIWPYTIYSSVFKLTYILELFLTK